jgi:hypothetical protein
VNSAYLLLVSVCSDIVAAIVVAPYFLMNNSQDVKETMDAVLGFVMPLCDQV